MTHWLLLIIRSHEGSKPVPCFLILNIMLTIFVSAEERCCSQINLLLPMLNIKNCLSKALQTSHSAAAALIRIYSWHPQVSFPALAEFETIFLGEQGAFFSTSLCAHPSWTGEQWLFMMLKDNLAHERTTLHCPALLLVSVSDSQADLTPSRDFFFFCWSHLVQIYLCWTWEFSGLNLEAESGQPRELRVILYAQSGKHFEEALGEIQQVEEVCYVWFRRVATEQTIKCSCCNFSCC